MSVMSIGQLQSKKEKQVPERGNRGHGTMGHRRPEGQSLVSTEKDGQRQPGPSVWRPAGHDVEYSDEATIL